MRTWTGTGGHTCNTSDICALLYTRGRHVSGISVEVDPVQTLGDDSIVGSNLISETAVYANQ